MGMEIEMVSELGKCRLFYPEFSRIVERTQDVPVPVQYGVHFPYPFLITHLITVMVVIPAMVIAKLFVDPPPEWFVTVLAGSVHILVLHLFVFCSNKNGILLNVFKRFYPVINGKIPALASWIAHLWRVKILKTLVGKNQKQ